VRKFSRYMSVSVSRIFVSWVMLILFPLSLIAADTGSAIVRGSGGVLVNGVEVADSIAVFSGDLLETKPGFIANLDVEGSSVLIQGESIVKFQGDYLILEHGSVAVGTSTSMSVHVNCLKVEPLSNDRTQYDVTDTNGTVQVAAHKKDVRIERAAALHKIPEQSSSSESGVVHEGEQATRDESAVCGAASPQGAGQGLNTKWLEIGGAAGGGALVLCLLLCKSKPPSKISPSEP
jgi:hypothetical protein